MSKQKKKRKQGQVLGLEGQELVGSADYIANREIDQIIKKGKDRLKHAITLSDEKLTKTKKEIIKEMAEDMEKAGYPVNQICDRLTKSLKGLVSERYVRELDAKYKNPEQSEVAKMQQNHDGGSLYRQQEQVSKKDVKDITLEDIIKADLPKSKLKQVAKYQMAKVEWWKQQVKQNDDTAPIKQHQDDKDKIIADLTKENTNLKDMIEVTRKLFMEVLDPKYSDEEVGKQIRMVAKQQSNSKPKK